MIILLCSFFTILGGCYGGVSVLCVAAKVLLLCSGWMRLCCVFRDKVFWCKLYNSLQSFLWHTWFGMSFLLYIFKVSDLLKVHFPIQQMHILLRKLKKNLLVLTFAVCET